MKSRKLLSGPYLFWAASFIIIPLLMILYYGLTDKNGNFTLMNLAQITTQENLKALGLALLLSFVSTLICLILAYPLAMILSEKNVNQTSFIVLIFILPMWMNFLLRTYAWMSILENNGFINQFFRSIGLISFLQSHFGYSLDYIPLINTQGAIVLGMVYNFLPFMVLPIYTVLIKLDRKLIEAAQDLGAPTYLVFRRVIFPLSIPGVISGITMVFVPSVSTFVISQMLGSGKNLLVGDLIDLQFMGGAYNPHLGSAIALVMIILIFICMWIMNKFDDGSSEEGGLLL